LKYTTHSWDFFLDRQNPLADLRTWISSAVP